MNELSINAIVKRIIWASPTVLINPRGELVWLWYEEAPVANLMKPWWPLNTSHWHYCTSKFHILYFLLIFYLSVIYIYEFDKRYD